MSTTDIQQHGGSTLALSPDQSFWTPNQKAALQQLGVGQASDADLAVFFHQAQATGLDPFKREIYMITRKGKSTIQTGIDGFYKIADRVTTRTGGTWGIEETYWCGFDNVWHDVWLSPEPPAAAKVVVSRNGSKFTTVAVTSEYTAQGPMWQKMPARMIAKCAEALAIRKAFPEDLSGLYTSDEMDQAGTQSRAQVQPQQRAGRAPAPSMPPAVSTPPETVDEATGEIVDEETDWYSRMEPIIEDATALRALYSEAAKAGADADVIASIAAAGTEAAKAA